jgi:hypothetical protein
VTDHIVPDDQANGMVDGTLPTSEVPAPLRGASELLAAAHQPATVEELSAMSAVVAQFSAAVVAPVVTDSPEPLRSRSTMFSTRIPKRAALMATVGILAVGTAAAAAGGALPHMPSPFSAPRAELVEPNDEGGTTTTAATTTATTDGSTTTVTVKTTEVEGSELEGTEVEGTEVHGTGPEGTEVHGTDPESSEVRNDEGRHHGLCEAWTHGAAKKTSNPAFGSLNDDAVKAGKTIDQFCADILAQVTPTTDVTGSTDPEGTRPPMPTHPTPTVPSHPKPVGPPTSVPPNHGGGQGSGHQGPPTSVTLPLGPVPTVPNTVPVSVPAHGGPGHGSGKG